MTQQQPSAAEQQAKNAPSQAQVEPDANPPLVTPHPRRPLHRRISMAIVMAVLAGLMGLLAAPQMMLTVIEFAPGRSPVWLVQIAALTAFEIGLWGSGLSVWFVARRLRLLMVSLRAGLPVIAAPVFWESLFNWFVGEQSPGWSSAPGLTIRLLVGLTAVGLALWHARTAPSADRHGK